MRIQTRLFLGTSTLMVAVIGLQWWLQTRELEAIDRELTGVATYVGEFMLRHPLPPVPPALAGALEVSTGTAPVELGPRQPGNVGEDATAGGSQAARDEVRVVHHASKSGVREETVEVRRILISAGHPSASSTTSDLQPGGAPTVSVGEQASSPPASGGQGGSQVRQTPAVAAVAPIPAVPGVAPIAPVAAVPRVPAVPAAPPPPTLPREVRIESLETGADRYLVIRGIPGGDRQIPVPISDSSRLIRESQLQSLRVTALLLLAGLSAAAMFAHRVTRPLRQLADGADALGRGALGTQVPVSDRGEIGDLQLAFNRMSSQLAKLEAERARWRAREHLAELGDVARGLAHTLRNPLHTLGLAVEELGARTADDSQDLVDMARSQIRRVDGWLRSFLAVGAGPAAEPGPVDLGDLVRDVALEAVQAGGEVEVTGVERLCTLGVAPALRAALANLVGNAVEASPPRLPVVISLERDGDHAEIRIVDRGPGLPLEVRERLFSPHTTTRAAGSGMGLFLAKQLIEGGHGGSLELRDGPEGGTIARVLLPLPQAARLQASPPQTSSSRPVPPAPAGADGQDAAGDPAEEVQDDV